MTAIRRAPSHCLIAESRDVDRLHTLLIEIGATVLDPPASYPQYGEGYYAVMFADPDGLKLELVYEPRDKPGLSHI